MAATFIDQRRDLIAQGGTMTAWQHDPGYRDFAAALALAPAANSRKTCLDHEDTKVTKTHEENLLGLLRVNLATSW